MAERRIIAKATSAGTRRLQSVAGGGRPAAGVTEGSAGAPTGLNAFLEGARRQGAELVAIAREQAEAIATNAREQGFAAGYAAGVEQGEKSVSDLLDMAERTAREAMAERETQLASCERDLVLLSVAIAEKVVQATLEVDPDRILDVLRGALRKTYVRRGITVICHPDDLARLEQGGPALAETLGGLRDLDLASDRRVAPGGVIVRTPGGDIDATLESQLDRLRGALLREGDEG